MRLDKSELIELANEFKKTRFSKVEQFLYENLDVIEEMRQEGFKLREIAKAMTLKLKSTNNSEVKRVTAQNLKRFLMKLKRIWKNNNKLTEEE